MRFREKFYRFMSGRNGTDQLARCFSYAALVCIVVNLFLRSSLLWALGLGLLILSYFRIFSRNVARRREENARFVRWTRGIGGWAAGLRDRWRQRKDYRFFRCPGCRAMLRVPRGKGRIRVTCRKCGNAFERKT